MSIVLKISLFVIPDLIRNPDNACEYWIPAFAGMTGVAKGCSPSVFSSFLFCGEVVAEKSLDLLPVYFNGEYCADEGCDQNLKNIAARAGVQVGEGIL